MSKERVTLAAPNAREYANDIALKLARDKLAAIGDLAEQCRRCEARYLAEERAALIDHLNLTLRLNLADGAVTQPDGSPAPMRETILLLHYFVQARGNPLTGKLVTYKELTEGINYFPVFSKRAIEPIVSFFGAAPEQLAEIAAALGGQPAGFGDVAMTVRAFPRVPLTFVLWRGDSEFPPEGSIMFDSTVADYLTNDDIHNLCEVIVWKMVRLLKDRR
jgi:hypothetical protein